LSEGASLLTVFGREGRSLLAEGASLLAVFGQEGTSLSAQPPAERPAATQMLRQYTREAPPSSFSFQAHISMVAPVV